MRTSLACGIVIAAVALVGAAFGPEYFVKSTPAIAVPAPAREQIPTDKASVLERLHAATAAAGRLPPLSAAPPGDIDPGDEVIVLRAIQLAADDRLAALHADPDFQEAAGLLLCETLRTGRGNAPVNPAIFRIVGFLPDSDRVSEIIEMAFSLQASPAPLWLDRLYERITPANVERVRTRVRTTPAGQVPLWERSLLALEGSDASQAVLQSLLADARATEARPGPRTQSRGLVPELDRLVALRDARRDPLALIRWGIDAGNPWMGVWAFDEALRMAGPDSENWPLAWDELVTATCNRLNRSVPAAKLTADAEARWMQARRGAMASGLRPWVDWAVRQGLTVPDAIRDLINAHPPPPISTGC